MLRRLENAVVILASILRISSSELSSGCSPGPGAENRRCSLVILDSRLLEATPFPFASRESGGGDRAGGGMLGAGLPLAPEIVGSITVFVVWSYNLLRPGTRIMPRDSIGTNVHVNGRFQEGVFARWLDRNKGS